MDEGSVRIGFNGWRNSQDVLTVYNLPQGRFGWLVIIDAGPDTCIHEAAIFIEPALEGLHVHSTARYLIACWGFGQK